MGIPEPFLAKILCILRCPGYNRLGTPLSRGGWADSKKRSKGKIWTAHSGVGRVGARLSWGTTDSYQSKTETKNYSDPFKHKAHRSTCKAPLPSEDFSKHRTIHLAPTTSFLLGKRLSKENCRARLLLQSRQGRQSCLQPCHPVPRGPGLVGPSSRSPLWAVQSPAPLTAINAPLTCHLLPVSGGFPLPSLFLAQGAAPSRYP